MNSLLYIFSVVHAQPVYGDAQVVIGEKGLDFGASYITKIPLSFEEDRIESEYDCWDRVGILNFNIQTQIEEAMFQTDVDELMVQLWFEPIVGTDMQVYAQDSDTFDFCLSYQSTLNYININDLYVELILHPYVDDDGLLALEVVESPFVTGQVEMDVSWFPDSLVLYFYEEQIFETVAAQMEENIPLLVAEYADVFSYQVPFDPVDIELILSDTQADSSGLYMAAKTDVHFTEEGICSNPEQVPQGESPALEFSKIDDAAFGIGVTERAINKGIGNLWSEGFFCFSEEDFDVLFASISEFFDPSIVDLQGRARLDSPPKVFLNNDGLFFEVEAGTLVVEALSLEEYLIDLELNLRAKIDFQIQREESSFGLTLHDLQLDFTKIDINGLLSDYPYAEENLKRFIEKWLVGEIEERIQEIPLFASFFQIFDLYIFVDELDYVEGGVEMYINLFQEGDPEIDNTAPDTTVIIVSIDNDRAEFSWSGTDDREDALVYSYRLDNESWSGWSTNTSLVREDLLVGSHIIQVKSRDRWWNEDRSPAMESFILQEAEEDDDIFLDSDCSGCSTTRKGQLWLWFFGVLLWGSRRR